jgi:hypothetical protein
VEDGPGPVDAFVGAPCAEEGCLFFLFLVYSVTDNDVPFDVEFIVETLLLLTLLADAVGISFIKYEVSDSGI